MMTYVEQLEHDLKCEREKSLRLYEKGDKFRRKLTLCRDAFVNIEEYWNRSTNQRATIDACEHAVRTSKRMIDLLDEQETGDL